jgi:hypothetical protein
MRSMRKTLRKREGKRFRVSCQIERFATKRGFKGNSIPTILLKNLVDAPTGDAMSDHLWFTCGKWCDGLKAGDTIEFDARVGAYIKGCQGRRDDVFTEVSEDYPTLRLTNQRSAVRDTTADLMLPVKRNCSRIFTHPMTGSLTRFPSTWTAIGRSLVGPLSARKLSCNFPFLLNFGYLAIRSQSAPVCPGAQPRWFARPDRTGGG